MKTTISALVFSAFAAANGCGDASPSPPRAVIATAPAAVESAAPCASASAAPDRARPGDVLAPAALPIDGAPARGPEHAPVTIVAFMDYECPFSARLDASLRDLDALYPGRVRVVYKALPLPMHAHARLAATAAAAAHEQGKFWAYSDRLFSGVHSLGRASLSVYAAEAGLDLEQFTHALIEPRARERVVADERDAATLGVTGTPTLFVNGHRLNGARPLAELAQEVKRALDESR